VRVVGPVKPYGIGLELCAPRSAMRSTVAAVQGNPGLSDRCNLFMCVLLPIVTYIKIHLNVLPNVQVSTRAYQMRVSVE